MTHVFQGEPDGRQSEAPIETSRFRPRYRPLSEGEKALHDAIKTKAAELEALYAQILEARRAARFQLPEAPRDGLPPPTPNDGLPPPAPTRYLAIATTDLETSVMMAVKALTS